MEGSFSTPTPAGTGSEGFFGTTTPPAGGMPPQFGGTPPAPTLPPIPWEDPARPFPASLFETIGLIFSRPSEAFARVPLTSSKMRPFLFGLIVSWVGAAAAVMYQSLFRAAIWNIIPGMNRSDEMFSVVGNVISVFFFPMFYTFSTFASAGITHLMLNLLGTGRSGYDATFRVQCYSGAAASLALIPFLGFFYWIPMLVFDVIGLAVVHRTTRGRAAAAVLLPALLCCVLICFCAILFGAALIAMFKGNSWN